MKEIYQQLDKDRAFFSDSKPKLTEFGKFLKWVADHISNETRTTITVRFDPLNPNDMECLNLMKHSVLNFISITNIAEGIVGSTTYAIFEKSEVDWN